MLSRHEKKLFLALAFSCLRPPGERRPFFTSGKHTQQELALLTAGLKTGVVPEKLLEKTWPTAYCGVASQKGKDKIFKYYFLVHNKIRVPAMRKKLEYIISAYCEQHPREAKRLVDWCTVWPAKVTGKNKAETPDGKQIITHQSVYPGVKALEQTRKGDLVLVHRGCACAKLSPKEFAKAVRMFSYLNAAF